MSREMLKNTVLALLNEAPGLGEVQLRKALVIVDILNMSYYGKGLTGSEYIKKPHGPVPDDNSWRTIIKMVGDKQIYVSEEPVGRYTKRGYYRQQEPDYSCFTQTQLSFIQDAAQFALKNTATDLSRMTHDSVWENTPMDHVIALTSMYDIKVKPAKRLTGEQKEEVRAAIDADKDLILALG